jgi:hypothetical protein
MSAASASSTRSAVISSSRRLRGSRGRDQSASWRTRWPISHSRLLLVLSARSPSTQRRRYHSLLNSCSVGTGPRLLGRLGGAGGRLPEPAAHVGEDVL